MGPPRVIGGYAVNPRQIIGHRRRFNGAAESNRRIRARSRTRWSSCSRFNGAAESNRRIRRYDVCDVHRCHCFNGAAESNRRILSSAGSTYNTSIRFNGAAESNRRIHAPHEACVRLRLASMGPPRVIGGYIEVGHRGERCSARFNGAAESNRRIPASRVPSRIVERTLQWGRRE